LHRVLVLARFRQELTQTIVSQLVLRVVVGHLAKLGDPILQLTHRCLTSCDGMLLTCRHGYFNSLTSRSKEYVAVFLSLLAMSVAFNSTLNLPLRLTLSRNSIGTSLALSGTSLSVTPVKGLTSVGLPFSSSTRISTWMLGCLVAPRSKPAAAKLMY